MICPVMMKGNKSGIRLIISPEATITQILNNLSEKLKSTGRYYANIKPITITFEGKDLTEDEKQKIIETLNDKGINVGREKRPAQKAKNKSIHTEKSGLFYIGNLKNGQSIQASASIVIVGDVESGASVESEGNIIVIGTLNGLATSGCKGKPDTFVYSLK